MQFTEAPVQDGVQPSTAAASWKDVVAYLNFEPAAAFDALAFFRKDDRGP